MPRLVYLTFCPVLGSCAIFLGVSMTFPYRRVHPRTMLQCERKQGPPRSIAVLDGSYYQG